MKKEKHPVWRLFGLALVYSAMGQQVEAEATLGQLIKEYQNDAAYQIAEVYAIRGETDSAFEWLERAYQQRDAGLPLILGDPLLKRIESDPRHAALLEKLHLRS